MNIGGYNIFTGDKGNRINHQLFLIKSIFESDKNISFEIFNADLHEKVKNLDAIVTCGERKIIFSNEVNDSFKTIELSAIPHLIRDVTYLRIIPKITGKDINNYPRFTWGKILPSDNNFPYDPTYDRWQDLQKKYNLSVKEYSKKGDNILFLLQVPTDASLNRITFSNDDYLNFVIRSIGKILLHTDRKIILRDHPLIKNNKSIIPFIINQFKNTNKVFSSTKKELKLDLDNARCVVSYNSSATVEALMYGVNVINLSQEQPCFTANNKIEDIENLKNFDRKDFLRKISFLHWSNEELESLENKKLLARLLIGSMKRSI